MKNYEEAVKKAMDDSLQAVDEGFKRLFSIVDKFGSHTKPEPEPESNTLKADYEKTVAMMKKRNSKEARNAEAELRECIQELKDELENVKEACRRKY